MRVGLPNLSRPRLREYQEETVEFVRSRRRSIVAHEPGLGKTACAIVAADLPCLVLCPAHLKVNWRREAERWRPEGADKFRIESYAFPGLRRLRAESFATVVADEAHYLKNPEARRARLACRLLRRAPRAVAMSGTPMPSRPIELWTLLYALRATELSWVEYAFRYCGAYENEWNEIDARGATRLRELRRIVRPLMIRREKSQVLSELPPKQWSVVALDLPVDSREKDFDLLDLDRRHLGVPLEALSAVMREHGLRKLAAAEEHCRSLLEGGARKLVVFAHHRDVVLTLAQRLSEFGSVAVLGGQLHARKQAAVDRFQRGRRTRVFVGQVTAAGVGWDLTAASHVVFAEASWVPAVLDQAADRCHRIGSSEGQPVQVDLLTIHRSVDELQLRRCLEKLEVTSQVVQPTPASGPKGCTKLGEGARLLLS